eukprot:11476299-Prorocentrum_lima.AAC.1
MVGPWCRMTRAVVLSHSILRAWRTCILCVLKLEHGPWRTMRRATRWITQIAMLGKKTQL